MPQDFITTQEAARLIGVHPTTIKRWVRKIRQSAPQAPIKLQARPQGSSRYLIDSDYLKSHYTPVRKSQSLQSSSSEAVRVLQETITLLKEQLAVKDKQIELILRGSR